METKRDCRHGKVRKGMNHILLCDDEEDIIYALKIYLENPEYVFFEANTGKEALRIVKEQRIDLVLMDIMMPEMDGITAMNEIRKYSNMPIILLTAKGEEVDKVVGLNAGADDYITKPFVPSEVYARVKAHLRRYKQFGGSLSQNNVLQNGGIEMDDESKIVRVDGQQISLTPIEYDMLRLFMENPGKVFSPMEIYRYVWKEEAIGSEGTVAVHIRHLREKIEINPAEPRYLKVVWGQGYRMDRK